MFTFEIAFLFMFSIVAVVTIAAVGRPLAEAHAEKLKCEYRTGNSQELLRLKENMQSMQSQLIELKNELANLQAINDFAGQLLESGDQLAAAKQLRKKVR